MAVDVSIPSISSEYIRVRVTAFEAGALVDPTANPPAWAFETDRATEPSSFTNGSWETDNTGPDPVYWARIQVGPGGDIVLTDETYYAWLQINFPPELVKRQVGRIAIT